MQSFTCSPLNLGAELLVHKPDVLRHTQAVCMNEALMGGLYCGCEASSRRYL